MNPTFSSFFSAAVENLKIQSISNCTDNENERKTISKIIPVSKIFKERVLIQFLLLEKLIPTKLLKLSKFLIKAKHLLVQSSLS